MMVAANIDTRSLRILNENGDATITWEPENDDRMEAIIAAKMAAGVAFYIVPVRKPGQRGRLAKSRPITTAAEAREHRALTIRDADLAKFVLDGHGTVTLSGAPEPAGIETARRAKTPREVATSHSVAVQPRRGG